MLAGTKAKHTAKDVFEHGVARARARAYNVIEGKLEKLL